VLTQLLAEFFFNIGSKQNPRPQMVGSSNKNVINSFQWEFQDPKMEVLNHINKYEAIKLWVDIPLHSPKKPFTILFQCPAAAAVPHWLKQSQ